MSSCSITSKSSDKRSLLCYFYGVKVKTGCILEVTGDFEFDVKVNIKGVPF